MIWMDYGILTVMLVSLVVGILRGFAKELLGGLTWGLAITLTLLFGQWMAGFLTPYISIPALRLIAAYTLLFFGGLLLGALIATVAVESIRNSRFSAADRTLGGGFGVIRGFFLIAVFLLVASTMGAEQEQWWRRSMLIGHLDWMADALRLIVPEHWLDLFRPTATPKS